MPWLLICVSCGCLTEFRISVCLLVRTCNVWLCLSICVSVYLDLSFVCARQCSACPVCVCLCLCVCVCVCACLSFHIYYKSACLQLCAYNVTRSLRIQVSAYLYFLVNLCVYTWSVSLSFFLSVYLSVCLLIYLS